MLLESEGIGPDSVQAGGECNVTAQPETVKNLKLEFKIMNLRLGGGR